MKQILLFIVLISCSLRAQNTEVIKEIKAHQEEQNTQFRTKGKSPLTEADRKYFKGLEFFEIDLNYRVNATFTRTPNEEFFAAGTSSGKTKFLIKYGMLNFSINGKDLTLAVYQSQRLLTNPIYKDYLFLPFNDLSNGETTYSGGRFIDLIIPKGNTILVDFNKAYNPYCAYSDGWNCTIPPIENNLEIDVIVGVKKYKDH
ncbi:MAG: DUF1684 domain-containing protein [Flavobacteriaceae bacterium]|nr:DUF1684 domain-containing protein [Flavobacteriaceae bacterium]